MTRRERLENKLASRLELAETANSKSEAAFKRSCDLLDPIPFGQPNVNGRLTGVLNKGRAAIARWNEDETITAIYCHNDGYPEYTGRILAEHYTEESKVKALLALGSISQLRPKLKPVNGTKHTFDEPQKDVTIAYHRDRKEPLYISEYASFEQFVKAAPGDFDAEYLYLFEAGDWFCKDVRNGGLFKVRNSKGSAA